MRRCKDCGAEIDKKGRTIRCRACSNKQRFEDPQYYHKVVEALKQQRQNPKRLTALKKRVQSPEYRQKLSEIRKQQWQDPERRRKRSQLQLEKWQDPDHQRKMSAVNKETWKDPEHRLKMSIANKAAWQDPERRIKQSKSSKERWQDPEFRRRMSDIKKKVQQNPQYRQEMSKAIKAARSRGCYDGVFQSPTSIELELAAALDFCSIDHRNQYRPDGCRFVFDEFVPPNILIETHGDYWHGPERPDVQERDKKKAIWTEANGYTLIIMWEHEIKECGAWSLVHERLLPLLP